MSCGLIDLGCQIHAFVDPLWGYVMAVVYVIIGLIVLGVLGYVYKTFGWKGVVIALTLGIAGYVYKSGYDRGRGGNSLNPLAPPTPPKAKPKKPKSHSTTITVEDPDFGPPPYFDPTQANRNSDKN